MNILYAAIDGEGELWGISEDPRAANPWFWADAMAEDSGCSIVELRGVPDATLEATAEGDRREAAEALRPYVRRTILSFP
jgi:hypothetical protein